MSKYPRLMGRRIGPETVEYWVEEGEDIGEDRLRLNLLPEGVPPTHPLRGSFSNNYGFDKDSVERFSDPKEPVDPNALMMASRDMRGDYLREGGDKK